MKTNSPRPVHELTDNEMAFAAGGLLVPGAIPGGYHVALPAGLFVNGYQYTKNADGTATFQNPYVGASGATY